MNDRISEARGCQFFKREITLCFTYQASLLKGMVRVGLGVTMASLALVLWSSHLLPGKVIRKT